VLAPQLARFSHPAGMRDKADLVDHIAHVVGDALGFERGVQSLLQARVMSGDAGRAGIPVALQKAPSVSNT
jgi:hypothetical protein